MLSDPMKPSKLTHCSIILPVAEMLVILAPHDINVVEQHIRE